MRPLGANMALAREELLSIPLLDPTPDQRSGFLRLGLPREKDAQCESTAFRVSTTTQAKVREMKAYQKMEFSRSAD